MHSLATIRHLSHFGQPANSKTKSPQAGKLYAFPVVQFSGRSTKQASFSLLLEQTEDSPTSTGFLNKVDRAIRSLPDFIQDALYNNGWRVKTAHFLTDIYPELKGVTPRGWNEWKTWDHASELTWKKDIALAEQRWHIATPPSKQTKFTQKSTIKRTEIVIPPVSKEPNQILCKNTRPDRVFRHETGHAFDLLMDNFSAQAHFALAYMKDFLKLSEQDKNDYYYYIQPDRDNMPTVAGLSEAAAEAFATLYGGGAEYVHTFRARFKNTIQFVQQMVKVCEEREQKKPPETEFA